METHMNLFGVPRHLEALIQAGLSFMWPLGSVLKTVWPSFEASWSLWGASWRALGRSQQRLGSPKMAFGRSWGRWSCTFAPRFCHYGNLVFKRVLGSSFSNCFGVMLKPKTVILLRTSTKNQKNDVCADVIKTLKYYRFGNDFWFNFGVMLEPKTVILLRTSFKNRIRDIFENIMKTVYIH